MANYHIWQHAIDVCLFGWCLLDYCMDMNSCLGENLINIYRYIYCLPVWYNLSISIYVEISFSFSNLREFLNIWSFILFNNFNKISWHCCWVCGNDTRKNIIGFWCPFTGNTYCFLMNHANTIWLALQFKEALLPLKCLSESNNLLC